jgi:hypothetical protein
MSELPLTKLKLLGFSEFEAKTHLFHGTGHAASLLKEDEYRSVIETFIHEEEEKW